MRNVINKTMIPAVAALTIGFTVAGPASPAFADGASHVSTTVSSPGSNNPYNPLAPNSSGEVGSIRTSMPAISVGQAQVNCHLFTHGMANCAWTPDQAVN